MSQAVSVAGVAGVTQFDVRCDDLQNQERKVVGGELLTLLPSTASIISGAGGHMSEAA